ncbi:Fur family ferric uptake regulator [Micromonospora sp. Llam0]|nr:Fur family ferric uptake regulator [Micromonospora sp. Llam0]
MTTTDRGDVVAEITAALHSRGERMTTPRRTVVEALAREPGHLTAEQVVAAVSNSPVHRASVYRTLDALCDLGVVQHVHVGHGATTYHLVDRSGPHPHGQCGRCGVIYDLPQRIFNTVTSRLHREIGFRLDAYHVALSGVCANCVATGADESKSSPA